MKKSLFLGLIGASVLFVSCVHDIQEVVPMIRGGLTLTAVTEQPAATRTAVESGTQVWWEPGDSIKVFCGSQAACFVSDLSERVAQADFFLAQKGFTVGEKDTLWALYPYAEEAVFEGEAITTILPSTQVARAESFGKNMNLSLARTTGRTLQFYNVGGGIRFTVTKRGIRKVIFEGLGGESISGKVKIGFDENGIPVVQEVVGGSQFITLLPPEGEDAFQKDTWYYLVAIPGALEKGYKLRFYKDTDYARKLSENAVGIKRSIYGIIENADGGIDYDDMTKDSPTTRRDWEESIDITNRVSTSVWAIHDQNKDLTIDEIIDEVLNIDEVIEVKELPSESGIAVMQQDSIWINYFFNPMTPIETNGEAETSIQQIISRTSGTTYHVFDENKVLNAKKKAIILSPFQTFFGYDLNSLENALLEIGYKRENIDVLPEKNASFRYFTGEVLSQYDFIFIATHGGVGYTAYSTKEAIPGVTVLGTSLRYPKGDKERESQMNEVIDQLIANKKYSKEQFALVEAESEEGKVTCCAMTPDFLGDARFDNACVILDACSSAKLSDQNDSGSMVGRFLNNGAAIVSGFIKDQTSDAFRSLSNIVSLTSKGFSFQDASNYIKESPNTKTHCDNIVFP